jgi:hypothetical protein
MFPVSALLSILVALLIVGVILWAVSQIPMDPAIAKVIRVVVIVFVLIWLIYFLAGMLSIGPVYPYPYRR